jgi:hypothetical protein
MARGGQIIDASIVLVPTQRNSRDSCSPYRGVASAARTYSLEAPGGAGAREECLSVC